MKAGQVIAAVAIGVVLQMALARYASGGRWVFDLVLVAVVYVALRWGPVAGMWAGTIGGLIQDSLSAHVVGIGGLAKTIAGAGAGIAGAQFIVSRAAGRTATMAVVTVVHRWLVLALTAAVDQRWSGVGWLDMLVEVGLNCAAALVAFQVTELVPGAVRQTRERRRPSFSRRRW